MSRKDVSISDMREIVYTEQKGRCFTCHAPMAWCEMELAHRIPQREWTLKKWGAAVIHHRLNLRGTHTGYCNAAAQCDPNSLEAARIVEAITRELAVVAE